MTGGRLKRVAAVSRHGRALLPDLWRRRGRRRPRRAGRLPQARTARRRRSPPCCRPAAMARWRSRTTAVQRFIEKPPGDNGLINGGFFVLEPGGAGPHRGRRDHLRARRRWRAWRATASWPPSATTASGRRWTRCATRTTWRRCGRRARPRRGGAEAADAAFWRGKRVLLTGHTGFKGAWAALWLRRAGRRGDRPGAGPPTRAQPVRPGRRRAALADRRSSTCATDAAVAAAVAGRPSDLVLHMAAQPIVRTGARRAGGDLRQQCHGRRAACCEALRGAAAPKAVARGHLATRSTPTPRPAAPSPRATRWAARIPIPAPRPPPRSPSAASRESYFEPAGVPLATARGGNVIGGGDFAPDRLLPDIGARRARPSSWCCATRRDPALAARAGLSSRAICSTRGAGDRTRRRRAALNFGPAPGAPRRSPRAKRPSSSPRRWARRRWRSEPAPFAEKATLAIDSSRRPRGPRLERAACRRGRRARRHRLVRAPGGRRRPAALVRKRRRDATAAWRAAA